MKHNFLDVAKMIDESIDKSQNLTKLDNFENLYEFFKQNGYQENINKFQKDIYKIANCVNFENLELNKVTGGTKLERKFSKTISAGMASLLMLNSSTYLGTQSPKAAHFVSSPSKADSNALKKISKKTIYKILGIAGIVSTVGVVGSLGYGVYKISKKSEDEAKRTQNPPPERKSMPFSNLSPISCGGKSYGIREIQQILSLYSDLRQVIDFYDKENNNNQNKIISMLGSDIDVCKDFIKSCEKVLEKKLDCIPSYSDIRQFRINLYNDMKKELKNSTSKWVLWEKCQSILQNLDSSCIHNIKLSNLEILNGIQREETIFIDEKELELNITVPGGYYPGLLILFFEEDIDKPIFFRTTFRVKPSTTYPSHSFLPNDECIVISRALDIMSEVLTNEHGFDENWDELPMNYPLVTVTDTGELYYHPTGKPVVYDRRYMGNGYNITSNETTCWNHFPEGERKRTYEETSKDGGTFMLLRQEMFEKCIEKARHELKY